jgi:hypothetical protein
MSARKGLSRNAIELSPNLLFKQKLPQDVSCSDHVRMLYCSTLLQRGSTRPGRFGFTTSSGPGMASAAAQPMDSRASNGRLTRV